jgi:hypothetical protein
MFQIPEDFCQEVMRKFDAHQALTVEADNRKGDRFGHGSLVGVDNQIDPATGTLKCKASLIPDGENLMVPGMFLTIRLLLGVKHAVILVPAEAVLHDPQGAFVWAIKPDQRVSRRHVQVGTIDGAKAEIQSGLPPGELVVIGPPAANLHDGQQVLYKLVQNNGGLATYPGDWIWEPNSQTLRTGAADACAATKQKAGFLRALRDGWKEPIPGGGQDPEGVARQRLFSERFAGKTHLSCSLAR